MALHGGIAHEVVHVNGRRVRHRRVYDTGVVVHEPPKQPERLLARQPCEAEVHELGLEQFRLVRERLHGGVEFRLDHVQSVRRGQPSRTASRGLRRRFDSDVLTRARPGGS